MARAADHPCARQSDAGNPAGGSARGAARLHHRDRPLAIIRTRSTTRSAFRTSSAARSTSARPTINEAMKIACVKAIAELARREASDVAARAYGGQMPSFGPDYLIPQPFDPRLLVDARAGRREGRDGIGRRDASARGFARVLRKAQRVRVPYDAAHEAGLRARKGRSEARRLCRGRRGDGAARGAERRRRRHRKADPDRPAGRHRAAHRAPRPSSASPASISSSPTSRTIRASRITGRSTTS